MENTIRNIVAQYGKLAVDVNSLDGQADLYRAGLTSHASINLMLALEEEFGIEFPQAMLRKRTLSSLDAIQSAVTELVGSREDGGATTAGLAPASGPSELVGHPGGL